MNPKLVLQCLEELRVLPYFTADEGVMAALLRLVGNMATDISQVRWLVARMTSGIYDRWPGPQEMRACFCSRFKPKDGLPAFSAVYPERWPIDPTVKPAALPAPPVRELPPGAPATEDVEILAEFEKLAGRKALPRLMKLTGKDALVAKRLEDLSMHPADRKDRQPPPKKDPVHPARRAEIQSMIDEEIRKRRQG